MTALRLMLIITGAVWAALATLLYTHGSALLGVFFTGMALLFFYEAYKEQS